MRRLSKILIYKAGDVNNPENYRGIAITSCIGKLFNVILNTRLNEYFKKGDILTDCQAGFRPQSITTDHMFILCLLERYTQCRGSKFCDCFIDLKRAFDTVRHPVS